MQFNNCMSRELQYVPQVKVCCITSVEEAQLAISAGAAAIGLVSAMPSGPGVIDERRIAEISAAVPSPIDTFLLTCHQDAESIAHQHALCNTSVIQLVDSVPVGDLIRLRTLVPRTKLVQVIHVINQASLAEARSVAPYVDALLLDSGNPNLPIKELGGTGRAHDWHLSRQIRDQAGVPVFLAGGLTTENVETAIATVRPFGVDLCSSVRSDGRLDPEKIAPFMLAVRRTCRTMQ